MSATVEKQNCDVRFGGGEGSDITSGGERFETSTLEDLDQKKYASMKIGRLRYVYRFDRKLR